MTGSTWLSHPAPHLGDVSVIAAPGWSSVVIEATTEESVAHVGLTRPDAAVVLVKVERDVNSPERTRRIVATYRWVLGQRVEPTTILMVVAEDQVRALTAALAVSGDPHPGGVVAATGPWDATNGDLRPRIACEPVSAPAIERRRHGPS